MGEHPNSAFALALALDYARAPQIEASELAALVAKNASDFFLEDRLSC